MRDSASLRPAIAVVLAIIAGGGPLHAAAQTAAPTAASTATSRPDAWRADLSELTGLLEARHPDPYHDVNRRDFQAGLVDLVARVPRLGDVEIVTNLARLLARVGDGHTGAFIAYDFDYGRLPLEFWNLEDGLLVAAASADYADLVGARVTSIGGHRADEVLSAVDSLVSRDNDYALRGPRLLLAVPAVLWALGVAERPDAVELEVQRRDGSRATVLVRSVAREESVDLVWIRKADEITPWLRDRTARYWFAPLPERRAVYFQYNDASWQDDDESLLAFADRLAGHVTSHDVERVIVDLRWNDGGSDRWTNIVLHALIRIEAALGHARTENRDPGPPLFVLIGPTTFSAATSLALDIEEHTNAVFVGEPTGGRPVGYGGQSFIDLARTGTRLRTSFRYQISSFPGDDRDALFPHVAAPPTIASYRANRDPAVEAALAWTPRTSIVERLESAAEAGRLEAARSAWRAWRADPSNRWLDPESDLNAAGYRLLREGETAKAVVLFQVNAEAHPRSANAHDSLGEGLAASGSAEEAIAAYERVLALDPEGRLGVNARRMIDRLRNDGP